jgi:multisubunit Na+/H+ antiporter MnhB subunit
MTDRKQPPDDVGRVESFGFRLGVALRILTLGFFTSVAGMIVAAGLDSRWTTPVTYASVGFGALCMAGIAYVRRSAAAASWASYVVLVGVGSVLQAREPRPDGALIAIAVGTIVTGVVGLVYVARKGRQSRELDRMLFTEATSIAFFVTMVSAISYALLESWIDAPKLSMWFVWTVGMGAWIVASSVFRRRYS